jgi:hypothetical protein
MMDSNRASPDSASSGRPAAGALLVSLLLVAEPAWASDYRGFISAMALICVVAPFALLNTILAIVLGLQGSYRKEKTAFRHTMIAAVGPAIGLMTMAVDDFKRGDAVIFLVPNLVALALAAVPLLVHNYQEWKAEQGGDRLPSKSSDE